MISCYYSEKMPQVSQAARSEVFQQGTGDGYRIRTEDADTKRHSEVEGYSWMEFAHPFYGCALCCYHISWRTAERLYFIVERRDQMDSRVALIGIVVEKEESVGELNRILHDYGKYIIGRMGIPYHKRNINIISIAVDAPADIISALSGKLGMLDGVSSKAVYSKVV